MLELIKRDIPLGAEIKLYLISGDIILGRLREVGDGFIIVEGNGSKKRFFEQMIGGWDIVEAPVVENEASKESSTNDLSDESVSAEENASFSNLTHRFINTLTEDELSFVFSPNAKIISADKKYVVIRTNDTGNSFNVPYKYIASKGIISDIDALFLSGEETQSTSIPVYVGFSYKDKTPVYPNIILEPGTMKEYCTLLTDSLLVSHSQVYLVKNLLFILWRGCKNKKAKDALKLLQSASISKPDKDFITEIDEQISRYSEKGLDINPLLTRKAQWLSSKNKYREAADAYNVLINSLLSSDRSSPQSISHNYTQLALMQMHLNDLEGALNSVHSALKYNPDNTQAQNLLNKFNSPSGIEHLSIESFQTPVARIREYTDSVLQDDFNQHTFVDPEARSNNDSMTVVVAERLLSQAEADDSLSSHYDAAKAYSLIPVSEDEDITNYATAMFGYASFRARSLYNLLINKREHLPFGITKINDWAYCYFVSAINFGSLLGHSWSTLFRDYLRMRVFAFALQHSIANANEIFELPLDEYINKNNLRGNFDFLLECSEVLISLGARCPIIREDLHGDSGKSVTTIIELLNALTQKEQFAKQLSQNNKCTHIRFNGRAESMITQFIDHRVKKLANLKTRINFIKNKSTEALFEASIAPAFKRLRKSSSFLTTTDLELSIEAERTMGTLAIFKSRTPDERRILAPSIKAEITNNLESIRGYSSYLCSDLLRDLWNRLLKSKYLSVNEATFALQSELRVSSDGNVILNNNGSRVIPISIINEGRSSIDKFKAVVTYSELGDKSFVYDGKRLSPGDATTILIDIPEGISDLSAYDYSVDISGLIINTWSSSKHFSLTASLASDVTFKPNQIKWDYQHKEIREDMFKGRNSDIEKLINTFTSDERSKIPVVFGLTRTGKSSILLNLQSSLRDRRTEIHHIQYTIVPIYIDLSFSSQFNDHTSFMTLLTLKCKEDFMNAGLDIMSHPLNSLIDIIELANSRNIYPVFLLDEFSYVKPVIKIEGSEFLKSIREYAIDGKAGFVYAGTYDILDIIRDPELNPSGTFMNIDEYKIYNLKDPKDAEALMRVMEPQLSFTAPAIKAIHDYSGDVPYWIQLICKHSALYALRNNRPVIGTKELDDVIKGILGEAPCKGIDRISDTIFEQQQLLKSDPKETKALLYSIAYLMKDPTNKDGVSWNRLKEFWNENSYKPNIDSIIKAKERLEDRLGLLSQEVDGNRIYRFSVGLFRRWCSRKDVISEFDRTNNIQ